jgi:hypothetical protein
MTPFPGLTFRLLTIVVNPLLNSTPQRNILNPRAQHFILLETPAISAMILTLHRLVCKNLILPRAYHDHSIATTKSNLIDPTSLYATLQYTANDHTVSHWRPLLRHFAEGLTTLEKIVEENMVEGNGIVEDQDGDWEDKLLQESRDLLDKYETVDKEEMMRIRGLRTVKRWLRGEKEVLVGMLEMVEDLGVKA